MLLHISIVIQTQLINNPEYFSTTFKILKYSNITIDKR